MSLPPHFIGQITKDQSRLQRRGIQLYCLTRSSKINCGHLPSIKKPLWKFRIVCHWSIIYPILMNSLSSFDNLVKSSLGGLWVLVTFPESRVGTTSPLFPSVGKPALWCAYLGKRYWKGWFLSLWAAACCHHGIWVLIRLHRIFIKLVPKTPKRIWLDLYKQAHMDQIYLSLASRTLFKHWIMPRKIRTYISMVETLNI